MPFVRSDGPKACDHDLTLNDNDSDPGRNPVEFDQHDHDRGNENLIGQGIEKFSKISHLIIFTGDKAIREVGQDGHQKKHRGEDTGDFSREIKQGHDERGIIFPAAIAPFEVCIVPMGYTKSEAVKAATDALYAELKAADLDVLLDDRNERPGVMFADMELIGIPHRIVVGERGLAEGKLEYKGRCDADAQMIVQTSAVTFIREKLCAGPSS